MSTMRCEMMIRILNLQKAISEAERFAKQKVAAGECADEFVEIADADGFRIYVAAGKTLKGHGSPTLHENPRDVFMLVLKGEIEFILESGEREIVKSGEYFVLPKHLKHSCIFRKMTIALEGVYEKDL